MSFKVVHIFIVSTLSGFERKGDTIFRTFFRGPEIVTRDADFCIREHFFHVIL